MLALMPIDLDPLARFDDDDDTIVREHAPAEPPALPFPLVRRRRRATNEAPVPHVRRVHAA